MDNYEITVTAASGIEGVVKKELKSLGFADSKAFDGSITVRGSSVDVARLNMFLRCADRVYITIGKFNASSFDELFDGVSALPLADIFPFNARIVVNGKCRKSRLFAVSSCQSVIKKAILGVLQKKYKRKVFPENGEILLGAENKKSRIVLSVHDNGIGIDPKYHGKIFAKFVQLDSAYTKKEASTGLGLTITKELVELHGGKISVKSEVNNGSTFIIDLPVITGGQ